MMVQPMLPCSSAATKFCGGAPAALRDVKRLRDVTRRLHFPQQRMLVALRATARSTQRRAGARHDRDRTPGPRSSRAPRACHRLPAHLDRLATCSNGSRAALASRTGPGCAASSLQHDEIDPVALAVGEPPGDVPIAARDDHGHPGQRDTRDIDRRGVRGFRDHCQRARYQVLGTPSPRCMSFGEQRMPGRRSTCPRPPSCCCRDESSSSMPQRRQGRASRASAWPRRSTSVRRMASARACTARHSAAHPTRCRADKGSDTALAGTASCTSPREDSAAKAE